MNALRVAALLIGGAGGLLPAQHRLHRGAAPPPAPGTIFLVPERIPARDGRLIEAERGLLFVPMSRRDTSRGVVAVEIWRFRGPRGAATAPVFRLPGGPGHDGLHVNLAQQGYYERQIAPITTFADYVVVGQRGIATSPPNTLCERGRDVAWAERCRDYWREAGLDLGAFTAEDLAHDVADAAAALGYDSIVVRGGSFGSTWALALMRLHPALVRRAVLNAVEGPDHAMDMPSHVLSGLRRIASVADTADAFRNLMPAGGLMAALDSIQARLRRAPVSVSIPDSSGPDRRVTFAAGDMPYLAFGHSGSAFTRSGIRQWPAEILRVYYGDFSAAALRMAGRIRVAEQPRWPFAISTAAGALIDCASGVTAARFARVEADPAVPIVGDRGGSWERHMCGPWGVDLGDRFRTGARIEIPMLLVQGTWDLDTPYENALELLPLLPRAKLIAIDGGTHAAFAEAVAHDVGFASEIEAFLRHGPSKGIPDRIMLAPIAWIVPPDLHALAEGAIPPRIREQ